MTSPRRVFIIGGGPSLSSFSWESLKGETVLAVNAAALHVGQVETTESASFVQDARCAGLVAAQASEWIQPHRRFCVVFHADTTKPEPPKGWTRLDGVREWVSSGRSAFPGGCGEVVWFRWASRVLWSSHAGPAALNLARQLWPETGTFYLLGFDYGGSGGKANFHDHYAKAFPEDEKLSREEDAKRWTSWRRDFEKAVARVREDGVRVVNLSPFSMIQGTEHMDAEAVLGAIA